MTPRSNSRAGVGSKTDVPFPIDKVSYYCPVCGEQTIRLIYSNKDSRKIKHYCWVMEMYKQLVISAPITKKENK